jgi:hypothetical protein
LQITQERKSRVIDLYFNQHKSYAEIAQIEHISPRDIHAIIKEEEARRQKYKDQHQQQEISSKAYKLFSEGKKPVEVAITLNLGEPEATKLYREYWMLKRLHILNSIYKETNGKLGPFLKIYKQLVMKRRMTIEQVVNVVDIAANRLPYMETLYAQVNDQVDNMQRTIQRFENDIEARKNKISILDKIAFSSEQECKSKEQELQELAAQKDRLEKWIANISNNDEIKQIVKENVEATLSENKQVISVAFTALIQTLKSDPKMINIIYKILTANDGEQRKGDNDSVTKYLESNKDIILDLGEKNYEKLLEALANNAINTVASSNFTLSLS